MFTGQWDRFMALFLNRGQCNLLGYRGSGKSLLGYAILEQALRDKYIVGVVANSGVDLPVHPWADLLPPTASFRERYRGIEGAGVYFDEAANVLDNRTFASNPTDVVKYLRKLKVLICYMSVVPVDRRLTDLQVTPISKFPKRWAYHWEIVSAGGKVAEEGDFYLWNPGSYFGKFDTDAMPTDDADILNLFNWTIADRSKWFAKSNDSQWWQDAAS